ncbi:YceI family protein [Pseudaquidulcibacter saccharophilus]|uniref:YceI family protein n=1 Tax=Pseudaquidulcibacter saccharophilus TaxID=2831900 RepID=UPI001EFF16AE|nr:YceI family protein [Pseudaquidulcibacter saccharophilus]
MKRTKILTFSAAALAISTLGGCVITDNSQVVSSVVSAPTEISPIASTAANLKEQPSGTYEIEPTHSKVFWRVTHMGFSNYTAALNKVSGTLNFDSANVTNSKVDITIDPNVVDTGNPAFDKEIADLFFETGKYPTIKFVSTSLVKTGDVTGSLTGNLTFHGVTKPVTLQVKFNGGKLHPMRGVQAMGFSAVGSFKRSDFGADKYVPMVGDEVNLIIETEFLKK